MKVDIEKQVFEGSLGELKDQVQAAWQQFGEGEQLFYNLKTFQKWLKNAKKIAKAEGIDSEDWELLELSVWLYAYSCLREIKISASELLSAYYYSAEKMKRIEQLLACLQDEEVPTSRLAKIMHDAKWLFLGKKRFTKKTTLWRLEQELSEGKKLSDEEWLNYLLEQAVQHHFYTAYAEKKYGARRLRNIAELRLAQKKATLQTQKAASGKNLGRGIDTLYRVNFGNHISLGKIADGKANILISINTILLSLIITLSGTGLTLQNNENILPLMCLLGTCMFSLIFAVLSTRPKVTEHSTVQEGESSMLFFGNFLQLPKTTFVEYMQDLKADQEALYGDLGKDLYNLGLVLRRKYHLLTIAYNVFLVGIIITVLFFAYLQIFQI